MPTDLVFARDVPPSTLARRVRAGRLVRLAPGVYTTNVANPEGTVGRQWREIVGYLLPGAVITDRSAPTGGPALGVLYLARPTRTRETSLPGLRIVTRQGAAPLPDDIPLPGGLYQASRPRGLIENSLPSRSVRDRPPRTLSDVELGDWLDRLLRIDGEAAVLRYWQRAEEIATELGLPPQPIARLSELVSAAVGTGPATTASPSLAARQSGTPYDSDRLVVFDRLAQALQHAAPQNRPAEPTDSRWNTLPFFEAYFSNYIEGTEFDLAEAARVVYEGAVPANRPADAHDLLGTYEVVSDLAEMSALASSDTAFLDVLRHRHAIVLAGRPDKRPGSFKTQLNRAGSTEFVRPDLVEGTLRAGFERLATLDTAWERAVYTMFLVSEVHPFDDGNGRVARIMMNAELVAGHQARIIIPTVYRDDYLGALRRLSRQDDPSILLKALRYAHDYTAAIDYTTFATAADQLANTHAFDDPDSTRRLVLPSPSPRSASPSWSA